MKKKGKIQIYTGNGKGKSTAAFGLALRAAGAGLKVFIAQFIKSGKSSEADLISKELPMIRIKAFGRGRFIKRKPLEGEKVEALKALEEIRAILEAGEYDVVIIDEVFPAMRSGLIAENSIKELILRKSQGSELVLTGRGAPDSIVALADLVTEMKEIKHYYKNGLKARKGIEF